MILPIYSEEVIIPDRVVTLHQLAYFLLREYVEGRYGEEYTSAGVFNMLYQTSVDYEVGLYSLCKGTARVVLETYSPSINKQDERQVIFIITKHLEGLVNKVKNN